MWPLFEERKMALACSNMEFLTFREWLRATVHERRFYRLIIGYSSIRLENDR